MPSTVAPLLIGFEQSQRSTSTTSVTVAGFGFRTIGRLVNHPQSINCPIQATTSNTSLAVAGFGFRTIGRLVNQLPVNNHVEHAPTSSTHFEHRPPV
ncbi:hypothetical protein N7517_008681 [Penicillium concentricum]|uniref:Uncharacterized protein n=1 Tax=Penicillium concentricum TaxID=293559 RepID=A0A9W9RSW5_9EURO|nr:uncharacterized protein N7517_008681 [Penicillium concentricum]KAJ5365795.1 hypothetical protein N7517_008681 [Penicillium concentricum]